jgi:hypothetical protein
MFEPLCEKTAEPPPPKGVSVEQWDKILAKGPKSMPKTAAPLDLIRRLSAREMEKRAFEELTTPFAESSLEALDSMKLAAVEQPELFKAALTLAGNTHHALEDYEAWGGTYKHAFGQQMFDVKQMAGSPAVAGGMNSRAKTPLPQMQQAPVSVTTTSIGQTQNTSGGPSTPSPTSQTSTPSAPTG